MSEPKEVTQLESDMFIQALNIQLEIRNRHHALVVERAAIDALQPQFEKMKDALIKTGTYKESDFKVRGA